MRGDFLMRGAAGGRSLSAGQRVLLLQCLCCMVYFVSYLTRTNYAAALSEMVNALHISNETAGLAVTFSFLTYGLGQTLCGMVGDVADPRRMIAAGLVATAGCNLLMPVMPNISWMTALWGLNGFFQSMLWPPLVRIMAENLSETDYQHACVAVSTAASAGAVAVYLLVPVCLLLAGWPSAFIVPAVFGLLATGVWLTGTKACTGEKRVETADRPANAVSVVQQTGLWPLIRRSALLPLMGAIVMMGILRDGITTWMPTFINERYHLGTSLSILSAAILPLFSIFSVIAASWISKWLTNEAAAAALLFGGGLLAAVGFRLSFFAVPAVPVAFMTLLNGCMHGVNFMLLSRLPRRFAPYGRVSFISGLLNTFTYVGGGLAAFLIGAVAERFGWLVVAGMWGGVALAGTLLCTAGIRRFRRFCKELP